MNKRKKLNKYSKRRLMLLLIILLLIFIIIFSIIKSDRKQDYNKYRIIIGENYIDLENDIYVDVFENIYLSKTDISKIYDKNIYYDSVDNILITTFNKHIAILKLDDKIININGSQIESKAAMTKLGDEVYLPFSEMGIIYDFEYYYSKETKTLIVDSISKEKKEATVIKNKVKVKEEPKLISSTVEKIVKDEKVHIIDESNERYYKIRTLKGNIGYIKKNKVTEVAKIRGNMETNKIKELNFLEYTDITKDYSDIKIDNSKVNAVNLNMFTIKNAEIITNIDTTAKSYKEYITWAENNNINIIAQIDCKDEIIDDFLTYNQRSLIIEKIYTKLIQNNLRVLNINFNKINDVNSFYRFLIELSPKLRQVGIKIIVTNNEILNEEKVNTIVDYLIK